MQEHPVPQNVTSFEFKLIGDMTLRQFGYVATGFVIALIAFFMPVPSPLLQYLVKYPLIFIPPLIGLALAFFPIEGRPMDKWLVSFMQAVFGNTLYVWKKEGNELPALHGANAQVGQPVVQTGPPQQRQQRAMSPLDALELQSLQRAGAYRPNNIGATLPQRQQARMATFAGVPQPTASLPPQLAQRPAPQTPVAIMREPHQRPQAMRPIQLPAYQQASIAQTRQPLGGHVVPMPQIISDRYPQPIVQRPMPGSPQQLSMLVQQNQLLARKIQALENQAKSTNPQQALAEENKKLAQEVSWLESTLANLQKNVTNLAEEGVTYQKTVSDLTNQLTQAQGQKQEVEQASEKLKQAEASVTTTESEKKAAEEKLADLKKQLEQSQALYQDLKQQKEAIAQQRQNELKAEEQKAAKEKAAQPEHHDAAALYEPMATPKPQPEPIPAAAMAAEASVPALTTVPNTIGGYVSDSDKKPLVDVIAVIKKAGGPTMRALKTNRVGQFTMISPLPDGKYEVNFEKDGYTFPPVAVEANGQMIAPLQVTGKAQA